MLWNMAFLRHCTAEHGHTLYCALLILRLRGYSNPDTTLHEKPLDRKYEASWAADTFAYSEKDTVGQIFSIDCRPLPDFHSSGGRDPSGWASGASSNVSNRCNILATKYAVWCMAKFWPRHYARHQSDAWHFEQSEKISVQCGVPRGRGST